MDASGLAADLAVEMDFGHGIGVDMWRFGVLPTRIDWSGSQMDRQGILRDEAQQFQNAD